MPIFLDYADNEQRSFLRGFVKGLAGPVVLFTNHAVPKIPAAINITPPAREGGDYGVICSDWGRIGRALEFALVKHEKEQQASLGNQANGTSSRQ